MTHDDDVIEQEPVMAPLVRAEITARCEEHARLKRHEADLAARCEQLAEEVDRLLAAAGLGEALLEGFTVGGHRVKLVAGETSKLSIEALVRLGCDPAWIEQATTKVPRKSHIRFTHPKG